MLAIAACAGAPDAGDAANAPKATDIRALRWIAPGADKVKALTLRPIACIRTDLRSGEDVIVADGAVAGYQERLAWGRIAFESPALLGGAAARMGLSCSSCHLNGRGNPDFLVEGVSGAPGTADVTSSLFSKVRGNGTFDPVPIPDLAARDGKQIKDRMSLEFRKKVHGLVAEEFDGQEPPDSVFDLVVGYLDRLSVEACENPGARVAVTARADASDAEIALEAADRLARGGRKPDALLMARASRSVLERLHERFIAPDQADVRAALVSASRDIESWSEKVRAGERPALPKGSLDAAMKLVRDREGLSLYNPDLLRAALARSPT